MASGGKAAAKFILLGRITKPHGIRGEVKVYPFSGEPQTFLQYGEILLAPENSEERVPYKIDNARVQGRHVLVQFDGCVSRTDAENLVGRMIWLDRRDLPEPGEDEFYLADLEGKKIVTREGKELGEVSGVLATPGQDILAVTGTGAEYLVPVHRSYFVSIGEDQVVLDLPPGLLDINRK